jgi:hypothetical protein
VTYLRDDTGITVVGFGHRGYAKAALRELTAAGYEIDEEMDGRNIIIGRLIKQGGGTQP